MKAMANAKTPMPLHICSPFPSACTRSNLESHERPDCYENRSRAVVDPQSRDSRVSTPKRPAEEIRDRCTIKPAPAEEIRDRCAKATTAKPWSAKNQSRDSRALNYRAPGRGNTRQMRPRARARPRNTRPMRHRARHPSHQALNVGAK